MQERQWDTLPPHTHSKADSPAPAAAAVQQQTKLPKKNPRNALALPMTHGNQQPFCLPMRQLAGAQAYLSAREEALNTGPEGTTGGSGAEAHAWHTWGPLRNPSQVCNGNANRLSFRSGGLASPMESLCPVSLDVSGRERVSAAQDTAHLLPGQADKSNGLTSDSAAVLCQAGKSSSSVAITARDLGQFLT